MKKVFCLILSLIISVCVNGNNRDSLKIVSLQREVSNLKSTVSRLQQEDGRLRGLYQKQTTDLDCLRTLQLKQAENVKALADKVGADISDANQKIDSNVSALSSSINTRTWFGTLGILIAIGLLGFIYYILRRRINSGVSTIDKIKSAQDGLDAAQKAMQEESVKLDSKLVELLDKKIEAVPTPTANAQADHKLALKVADEIVRIEMNLSKMDPNIRGYNQLKHAVNRIRNNFSANGYEIVEMLGKPFNEGMKATVSYETDESLKEGERIISRITKPQVNFNGKLIQVAEITVSENI